MSADLPTLPLTLEDSSEGYEDQLYVRPTGLLFDHANDLVFEAFESGQNTEIWLTRDDSVALALAILNYHGLVTDVNTGD